MDGAVFAQQHASGVGVVIRDHEGLVVAALSKKLWYPLGPLEAEAKAMEEAVEFAWHVGIRDAHFECDSILVSDAVRGLTIPQVSISNIIYGTCHRLEVFCYVQFSHDKREGNKPAHILAQYAKGLDSYVTLGREKSSSH